MYDVLDICRYVIKYSNEKGYGISHLKLQKVLYFIQVYFLCFSPDKKPCFREKIEAWNFGPVVQKVYQVYKQYGSCNIPFMPSYLVYDPEKMVNVKRVKYDDTSIKRHDKSIINSVIDKFSGYSATDLVTLTHNQAPWKDAYEQGKNNEITHDAIRKYFNA